MKYRKIAAYALVASLTLSMGGSPILAADLNDSGLSAVEASSNEWSLEEESSAEAEALEMAEESATETPEASVEVSEWSESEAVEDENSVFTEIDTTEADIEGAYTRKYLFGVREDAPIPEEGSGISYLMDQVYMADLIEDIYASFSQDEILYIEENATVEFFEESNDLYYSKQKQYLENVHADSLWERNVTGEGVTVAVIDSGLFSGHEDFDRTHILPGYNYVNQDEDTRDSAGHGTQVAGVIAAVRNNQIGVAGLLSEVNILPMRISANSSSSPTIAVVAKAIQDAVDKYDVQVINMSIGQKSESETMEVAVKYAAEHNVIMVAAAGNSGNDTLMYPAAYDEVIGVGALDQDNQVRDNSQRNNSVFVTAPGENIYTTDVNDKYTYKSGTSYSAPFVSAMAAAAKAKNSSMTIQEFKNLLISTSVDAGETGYDTSYGYGTVDFDAFLSQLNGESGAAGTLTVFYQDAAGTEIASQKTKAVREGRSYQVSPDTIEGYRAVSYKIENAAAKDGSYTWEESTNVVISYEELSSGKASITYVYEKTNVADSTDAFTIAYERAYGSTLADAFHAVAETPDGGYIAVGYTFGESTNPQWGYNITSERYPNANNDAIMVKFDSDAKVEWARNFGTSGVEVFEDVTVLSDGSVIAVGRAPYDFGTGKSTVSGYIVRLDDSRIPDQYEEIHVGGTTGGDFIHAVEATGDGGYVIAGRTSSYNAADWNKVHNSTTTADAFIAKYDSNGSLVFSKCFSQVSGKRTYFNDIAIDGDGNIIAVGENQTVKYVYNAQIVKFNGTTGDVIWSRSEGSALTEEPDNSVEGHTSAYDSVAVLSDGSYVVTGTAKTTGSTTGEEDPVLLGDSTSSQNWGIAGEKDGIVVRYTKDGKVSYATNLGTAGGTVALSGVAAVDDGGYLVFGQTSDEIYGSDQYIWKIKGATDTVVVKYNSDNTVAWSQSYGTSGKGEWFNDILVKKDGTLFIVGETNRNSSDGKIDASVWTNFSVVGDDAEDRDDEIEIPAYADGTYEGRGIGFNTDVPVVVSIVVKDGKIESASLVSHKDTASYMRRAADLLSAIPEKQTYQVDTVTGATYSSRGLKRAAAQALDASAKVAEVIDSINELPEATEENRAAIEAVAEEYNALDEAVRANVTNYPILEEALQKLADSKSDSDSGDTESGDDSNDSKAEDPDSKDEDPDSKDEDPDSKDDSTESKDVDSDSDSSTESADSGKSDSDSSSSGSSSGSGSSGKGSGSSGSSNSSRNTSSTTSSPRTGDRNDVIVMISLMCISGIAVIAVMKRRKRA